jgi:RNA polymerase sigma-70 factor (ECF subfamily)
MSEGIKPDYEGLYRLNSHRLRNFLRRYLNDDVAAEDIVQESFLQLYKNPDGYRSARGPLKPYLYGIAVKRAANWLQKQSKSGTCASPHQPVQQEPMTFVMADALERLEPDVRALIWLREVEGYRNDELAAIFGIPEGTVKSRLHSAREHLRKIWQSGSK